MDNNLRYKIIYGIRNDLMRRRLSEEAEPGRPNRAVQVVTSVEAAAKGAEQIAGHAAAGQAAETTRHRVAKYTEKIGDCCLRSKVHWVVCKARQKGKGLYA